MDADRVGGREAPAALAGFIARMHEAAGARDPQDVLAQGAILLRALVARDDWLPPAYAASDAAQYRQYLLHGDPQGRFSLVSFVLGAGQGTPIHDHTVWGAVGVLRGAEVSQRYAADGIEPPRAVGAAERLAPGDVDLLSPAHGDVHSVRNALSDGVSVSIHLYGADIASVQRSMFPPEGGRRAFSSAYANDASTPPFAFAGLGA